MAETDLTYRGHDAIVIGAGLAGLMSALVLAEAGHRPLVLAKGHGATHWISGTVDVWDAGSQPLESALAALVAARPDHPYALIGRASLAAALERFRQLMADARYPYAGGLTRNLQLPTALGALRPASMVPVTMLAGDSRLGGELLIAGFRELRDFFPPLAAANLTEQGIAARGVYLDLPPIARRLDFTTVTFARLFDDREFRRAIGGQLRALRGQASRIGLPAVLGLRDPLGVVADLQHLCGAQVFEIPTLPPSVPGMRLFTIFRDAISAAGGQIQIGAEVLHGAAAGPRLTAVYSAAAARTQEHRARSFVLATGGVAGGGITTDHTGSVTETALGLPLQAPHDRGTWFAQRFLDPAGHPIFQAGVAADTRLRPLDQHGSLIYENVAVAGATLAGSDPIRERCLSGQALATGWHAAQMLQEYQTL